MCLIHTPKRFWDSLLYFHTYSKKTNIKRLDIMKEQMIITTISDNKGLVVESADVKVNESLPAVPDGCMRLSGVFGVTGVMNNNKRYYTTSNYKTMVESLQNRMQNTAVFGELEHPDTMQLNWDNVTHKIEDITIDEKSGVVSGTILLLNTEKGANIQKLVENGLQLRISSRGRGIVSESGEVTLNHLETYDLVYRSGFNEAVLSVCESELENGDKIVCETVEVDIDKDDEKENVAESVDVSKLKSEIKAELKAELLAESKKDNFEAIEKFVTELVENNIEASEERTQNLVHESMLKFGKATQNWAIMEFAPQIQGYLNEHFFPKVKDWSMTELAEGIQSWAVNEFAPEMETYFTNKLNEGEEKDEEKDEEETDVEETEVNNDSDKESDKEDDKESDKETEVDETEDDKEDDKESDKENVDESVKVEKTLAERIDEELASINAIAEKEQSINEAEQEAINEAQIKENFLMGNMPNSVKHLWESSDEKFQEQVKSQASLRNFVNESQVVRFWISRFTKDVAESFKAKEPKVETQKINEGQRNALLDFAKMINS